MFSKQEKTDGTSANLRMPDSQVQVKERIESLKKYVNCPEFIARYREERDIPYIAEAMFWSVKLGLDKHFEKMAYEDILKFKPIKELIIPESKRTELIIERTELINNAYANMSIPEEVPSLASYALIQTAFCVYVHIHSFEKLKEEEEKEAQRRLKGTYPALGVFVDMRNNSSDKLKEEPKHNIGESSRPTNRF